MAETKKFHEIHPGFVLKEELKARGLSAAAFALRLRVPPQRIQEIVAGKRAITPDTALRLGKVFATSPEFWMNLQTTFDLTARSQAMKDEIAAIEEMRAA